MEKLKELGGYILMAEKEDNKENNIEELPVDEEAKKQFLEELKNKNLEEEKKLEELKNKELEEQKKIEEEQKKKELEEQKKIEEEQKKKEDEEKNKQVEHIEEKHANEETSSTTKSSEDTPNKKTGTLMRNLKVSFIDTAVSAVVSIAALYLFDLILRLIFGYYVSDMRGVFIILFIVILILYPVVMKSCKLKKTLGEKFAKTTSIEGKD